MMKVVLIALALVAVASANCAPGSFAYFCNNECSFSRCVFGSPVNMGSCPAGTYCQQSSGTCTGIGQPTGDCSFRPAGSVGQCVPPAGPSGTTESHSSDVPNQWFALFLQFTQFTAGFSPPVAARAFGYAGLALYESVVDGSANYKSLAGQLNDFGAPPKADTTKQYHWPSVANAALAAIGRHLYGYFPNGGVANKNLLDINALESAIAGTFAIAADVRDRSVAHGQAVAAFVACYADTDGGKFGALTNFPSSYTPPVGDGLWVPTPPAFQSALQPFWGRNRPFVLKNLSAFDPGPPPAYGINDGSQFWNEVVEVYDAVENATPEHIIIAEYWADNPGQTATPPGHSVSIARQLLIRDSHNLAFASQVYARVGMAVNDAFISCWWAKYKYNLVRPITVIRDHIDPSWDVIVGTPPFPEYTSGHSVQSGATAAVLKDLFGHPFAFTDHTHSPTYAPRSFSSFDDFADEAAISRLYGGIHFRAAIDLGVDQGELVGEEINKLGFHHTPTYKACSAADTGCTHPGTVTDAWCATVCPRGFCPPSHCVCA